MSEQIQDIIARIMAGNRNEVDLQTIAAAIESGQVVLVPGKGAVGISGNVENSAIVPGNQNVINSNNIIVVYGADAEAIQTLLSQRLSYQGVYTELVQQVRQRCCDKALKLYSKIQLLNCQQVDVDRLYVDVYVLEKLSNASHATIPALLQGQDLRDSFDRIGLGKREKRSPGLEVAAEHPRLMVFGKPGSGKSTFLRHLAVACATGEFLADCIPVLFELRFVKDSDRFNLWEILKREFRVDQTQVEQVLEQTRVLLLLDGLDEVPASAQKAVQDHILEFAQQHYDHHLILTCRTQTTEYILPTFEPVEVADFNPEQVEAFTENWFGVLTETCEEGAALTQRFITTLQENRPTAELAITPVLLSLTCWVFGDLKDLPSKRSDLYERGICLLLRQWDEQRGIRRDGGNEIYRNLSPKERQQLLSHIAVRKFEQLENFVLFEQSEICSYIAEHLQISTEESQEVLKVIAQQHGLLIERADRIWSFSHLTFQEYLMAKWFCEHNNWIDLVNHMHEKHWREVILLAVEMMQNVDAFVLAASREISSLLALDLDIQIFLDWISQKENTFQSSYKPAVIRAIYFCRFLDIDLETERDIYKVLTKPYKDKDALILDLRLLYDQDFAMIMAHNLERTHTHGTGLSFSPRIAAVLSLSIPSQLLPTYGLNLAFSVAPDLKTKLENIRLQIPSCKENSKSLQEWWYKNGKVWLERLRAIMIEYRDIGYNFDLSEHQKAVLKQYYDANLMLLDCINSNDRVSNEVRTEIEETLFLPIAEIEKRKNHSLN